VNLVYFPKTIVDALFTGNEQPMLSAPATISDWVFRTAMVVAREGRIRKICGISKMSDKVSAFNEFIRSDLELLF